jgi:hypothetical protein
MHGMALCHMTAKTYLYLKVLKYFKFESWLLVSCSITLFPVSQKENGKLPVTPHSDLELHYSRSDLLSLSGDCSGGILKQTTTFY